MPKRLVRHALVTYVVNERQEMAFRGQVVDLSDAEAKRFDALGATVPEDAELERPGTLAALPESPTDEEVIAFAVAATDTELRATLQARPELGPRIEGAKRYVVDLRKAQDEGLAAAAKAASGAPAVGYLADRLGSSAMLEEGEASAPRPFPVGSGDGPTEGQGGDTPANPGDGGSGPSVTVSDPNEAGPADPAGMGTEAYPAPGAEQSLPNTTAEVEEQVAGAGALAPAGPVESYPHVGDDDPNRLLVRTVVAGNVDDVTEFVSENPELAPLVLEEEGTARAAQGKEPRQGIVKAVQAAQGHTQ